MNQEGPEGDEPDFHPEELQGHEGEMQLFIVPPNPPSRGKKRARSRGKKTTAEQPHPSAEPTQPQPTASSGTSKFKSKYVESTSSLEEKSELDLYLAEPVKKLGESVDILDFWSKSAARYPQLAKMARDILAIHVSSVASESAFSLSKKIITPNRSSLKPNTIEALMCLQNWYRCNLQKKDDHKKKEDVVVLDEIDESSSDEE